jgi:uncharacterized protein YbaP (TraB family)
MKKIGPYFFVILICVLSKQVFSQVKPLEGNTLLWEISGKGLKNPSYIYGTMHVKDSRVFNFADSVLLKIEQCQAFALEVHPDSMIALMLNPNPFGDTVNRVKEYISDGEYRSLNYKMKKQLGFTVEQMGRKDPAPLSYYLEMDRKKTDDKPTFLDGYLYGIARAGGKTILGLENVNDQLGLLKSLSQQDQKETLLSRIDRARESKVMYERLVSVYKRQNLDAIDSLVLNSTAITPDFYGKLITLRNRKMVDTIISIMKKQTLFAAVGAAHFAGDEGLINLLRRKGYTMRPVLPVYTGLASGLTREKKKFAWYKFKSEKNSFSLKLPSKPYKVPAKNNPDMDGVEMFLLPDLGTGTQFTVTSMLYPARLQNKSGEQIHEELKERYREQGYKFVKESRVTVNGVQGMEFLFDGGEESKTRAMLFLTGQDYILLEVGNTAGAINSDEAARFFASLKIQARKLTPASRTIVSEKGAFKIEFPGTPVFDTLYTPNTEGLKDIRLNIYSYTDLVSNCIFVIRYFDYEAGVIVTVNDSTFFRMTIDNLATTLEGTVDAEQPLLLDGFPGMQADISAKDNLKVRTHVYRRGNREYNLYAYYPDDEFGIRAASRFLGSFKFIDYKPDNWNPEELSDKAFKVKVPSGLELAIDTGESVFFPVTRMVVYSTISPNSGQSYMIFRNSCNKYYSPGSSEAFFNKWYDGEVSYADSVREDTFLTVNGFPAREIILKQDDSHVARKLRVIYTGNEYYELKTYFPWKEEFIRRDRIFFESFAPGSRDDQKDLFNSRAGLQLMLKDIASADSTDKAEALSALSYYNLEKRDLPDLFKALQRPYAEDSLQDYLNIRSRLLSVLQSENDSSIIPFIENLYVQLEGNDYLRVKALNVLTSIDTPETVASFKKLVALHVPVIEDQDYGLFGPFYRKFYQLRSILPEVEKFIAANSHTWHLYHMLAAAHDSGFISPSELVTNKAMAIKQAGSILGAADSVGTVHIQGEILQDIAKFLGMFKNDAEAEKMLLQIASDESYDLRFVALTSLIRIEAEIPEKLVATLAADRNYRVRLYEELQKIGKEKLFPKKFYKQQLMAESDLAVSMNSDYEYGMEADSMVFVRAVEMKYGGKDSRFYVFKYAYRYTEEGEQAERWYAGVSGPFPKDKKQVILRGSATTYGYEDYSEEAVQRMLEDLSSPPAE